MIDLYLTEKALAKTGVSTTTLIAGSCAPKKLRIVETGGTNPFDVEFRDGTTTGRLVAHMRVPANGSDTLSAGTGEMFHFLTNITINIIAGGGLVQVYTPGNPLPTFA